MFVMRWLKRWTIDAWREIHEDSLPRDPAEARRFDWQPLVLMVVVTLSLIAQHYFGDRDTYQRLWPRPGGAQFVRSDWELGGYVWWAAWRVGGFLVLPIIAILCTPGVHLRDMNVSLRGFWKHLPKYLFLLAVIAPAVFIASRTPAFQETYPFYRMANRSFRDLAIWECCYIAQFLSLEFFFRGYMLAGLRKSLGAHAIWVMIVPYVMIHFGKPVIETTGAIVAGVVLGTLAMKTRSIWGGVIVHVVVAVSMDVMALSHCPIDRPCPGRGAPALRYENAPPPVHGHPLTPGR